MTDRKTMDLAERRQADRKLSESRRDARNNYVRYCEEEADAERDYRKALAMEFTRLRSKEEAGVTEAELRARGHAADIAHKRDLAHSMAKASLLRIDELERESVSVRDLHSSSERVDGLAA